MNTIEKIRAEIAKEVEKHYEEWQYVAGLMTAMDIFKKYAEQEPCDDVVSRQAVLDGLKVCLCEEWVKTLFATMVKQLPSVRPQEPKWISVSERLPEEKGVYLVARKNKGFGGKGSFTNHISINVRGYTGGTSRWGKAQCGIVAWMPLPKPYEPQESEVKE